MNTSYEERSKTKIYLSIALLVCFVSSAVFMIYTPSSSAATGPSILVVSKYLGGASLTGMYTILQQGRNTVGTGYTPVTFSVTSGQSYVVTVDNYNNAYFYKWSDGVCTSARSVIATSSQVKLTAIFTRTPETPPNCKGGDKITVDSTDLHTGAAISGFYVD